MASIKPQEHVPLERVIGVGAVAFTAFNCIVGAGIFGLPALVAAVLGPAALIAYAVCLILIACVGLCFAEAGSRVSSAGGLYAYVSAAFGPVMGGIAGMLVLIANSVASGAALARFSVDTLAAIWPVMADPWPRTGFLAGVYLLLTVVNIHGARDGARLAGLMAFIKLAPLVLLVVVGAFAVHGTNLRWHAMPAIGTIGEGAVILFFAFMGLETGLTTSAETVNPARTIPRAILLALSIVAFVYVGLQVVAQGVLGAALPHTGAPLVATATAVFGPWGSRLLVGTTVLSGLGYMVADMLASPRIAFALAEAGQLPRWFANVHPRRHTPAAAIASYALLSFVLAASGTFRELVVLASSGTLALYLLCCLGVRRLRARKIAQAGPPFRAPGGPVVPILAAGIIVWLLSTLAWSELAATLILIAVSAAAYTAIEWRRRGAAGKAGVLPE